MQYFEVKVKYLKQNENGLLKATNEQYLVNAMSFTEAETRIGKELEQHGLSLEIATIAKSKITDVIAVGDSELWFRVRASMSTEDEDGKAKRVPVFMLINASDAKEAESRAGVHMTEVLVPWEIVEIKKSPIIEIFKKK